MRPPNPPPQLIELRETELVGAVNNDGIGVGKIEPRFDDRRANQDLRLVFQKIEHDFLQLPGPHLAVRYGQLCLGDRVGQLERQPVDGFDPIVEEKHLPTALHLTQDRVANDPFVVAGHVSLDRQPIRRRCFDDAQLANADHRHMQGARDRRRR